jgi:broad specificity phosphatase PhoE
MSLQHPLVHICRHAQSLYNKYRTQEIDCSITALGRVQASELTGHYSLVIMSPMIRTQQTLQHSLVTYDQILIEPLIREKRNSICDFMIDEDITEIETETSVQQRVKEFNIKLKQYVLQYPSILIVSHAELMDISDRYAYYKEEED